MKKDLEERFHYHFIGIGGIGMSGIALALIKKGYSISGSDLIENDQVHKIKSLGATVFNEQNQNNIEIISNKFDSKKIIIVKSSAINELNSEFKYCKEKKLPILHRSEVLSKIMQSYISIAVSGTHGKTSTSTLLATLLDSCTNSVSSIIGGIQPSYESNCNIKQSKYLVAEIDESDGSNIVYKSNLGIINNIDFDHCDYYSNLDEIVDTFKDFEANSEKLLINHDCQITRKNINFDFSWSIKEIINIDFAMIPERLGAQESIAKYYEKGRFIDTLSIPIPGLHNLSNITAAIAACRINNVDFQIIKKHLQNLQLPKKRFEYRGELVKRIIIDDYAHHPNAIKETLKLGRLFINKNHIEQKRLVAIFQPHRYSRVNKLAKEFGAELQKADLIILTDIYSAGEINTENISSQIIAEQIRKNNKNVILVKDNNELREKFFNLTNKGDFIINMGAGDCHKLYALLNEKLNLEI